MVHGDKTHTSTACSVTNIHTYIYVLTGLESAIETFLVAARRRQRWHRLQPSRAYLYEIRALQKEMPHHEEVFLSCQVKASFGSLKLYQTLMACTITKPWRQERDPTTRPWVHTRVIWHKSLGYQCCVHCISTGVRREPPSTTL